MPSGPEDLFDPLIAIMGALSALYEGEHVVERLMVHAPGPDWSQAHLDKVHKRPCYQQCEPSYTYQTKPLQIYGVTMADLGIGALAALKGYLWVQDAKIWNAALVGTGTALGVAAGGWPWCGGKRPVRSAGITCQLWRAMSWWTVSTDLRR